MIFDWGMVVFFGLCVDVLGLYLIDVLRRRYPQLPAFSEVASSTMG
jgi:hypothetical protein